MDRLIDRSVAPSTCDTVWPIIWLFHTHANNTWSRPPITHIRPGKSASNRRGALGPSVCPRVNPTGRIIITISQQPRRRITPTGLLHADQSMPSNFPRHPKLEKSGPMHRKGGGNNRNNKRIVGDGRRLKCVWSACTWRK
jgi:hypothetical protein